MNVNGVTGYSQLEAYSKYAPSTKNTGSDSEKVAAKDDSVAAVYEKSQEASSAEIATKKYTPNTEVVNMIKSSQEELTNQLLSYVQKSLMGQGNALASTDSVWQFLASGNFTVDEAAKEEAKKSLEEGGYWSVESTSDRIVEFAKALTGGDPSKVEDMRNAIEKGFKEATKTWGRDLPDITNDTYNAIQKKLDEWATGVEE